MRSHLRHDAIWLCFLIALAFQLTYTAASRGDESEAKATAALALAKAKREREQTKALTTKEIACHTDYTKAAAIAAREKKPLVKWVGVKCVDYPELRKALSGAVHCHLDEDVGSNEPRIVIQGGDGLEYFVRPEKITEKTAAKIQEKWNLPYVPPLRPDVRISEEFSRLAPRPRPEPPIKVTPIDPKQPTIYGRSAIDNDPFVREWDAAKREAMSSGKEVKRDLPGGSSPYTFQPDGSVSGAGQFVLEPFSGMPQATIRTARSVPQRPFVHPSPTIPITSATAAGPVSTWYMHSMGTAPIYTGAIGAGTFGSISGCVGGG